MIERLNLNKLRYVDDHFRLIYHVDDTLGDFILNYGDDDNIDSSAIISFYASDSELDCDNIVWLNEIPILYPMKSTKQTYRIQNGKIRFTHDILKSAFYLLSAYQELQNTDKDAYGRFKFQNSIQFKLRIVTQPTVNYYFQLIANTLNEFFGRIAINERNLSNGPVLALSHDIDVVQKYSWNLFKAHAKKLRIPKLFKFLARVVQVNIFRLVQDPYWSFDFIQRVNKEFDFKSTYFLLPPGERYVDARYDVNSEKMVKQISLLESDGADIALHGTVKSSINQMTFKRDLEVVKNVSSRQIIGIRQHRLYYNFQETARIHVANSMQYDATFGFAEHHGIRTSFCFPSKPFDFKNDCSFPIWCHPLHIMDVTLFKYLKYTKTQANHEILSLAAEFKKFNGVLSILWHNSFLDNDEVDGIRDFYRNTLESLRSMGFSSKTHNELVEIYLR